MNNNIKSLRFKKNPFHTRIKIEMITLKDRNYSLREDRDRYFFPDEWKAFHDCLKKKQELTFDFLINTGARINECRNVRIGDIDFERNSIVFRWTKTRNKDGTRKIRTIPISPQFAKYLKKVAHDLGLKDNDFFPILSTPAANIAMKKALQEAEIPDWKMFSVHNVRKTLETWLIALDVDSMKVIKHFGHGLAMALKHYVSPDVFGWEDKDMIRDIIGDLYREVRR
jgi:integrase